MSLTVTMPQLGETVTEGTILKWSKQPGDTVREDEVLLEISKTRVFDHFFSGSQLRRTHWRASPLLTMSWLKPLLAWTTTQCLPLRRR